MSKVFDVFYKKGKGGKTKYAGSLWEGKYADEQRAEGKEPWLDVNLSVTDKDGKRHYARSIDFGPAGKLTLGKESGVFLKAGICKGLTIAELDGDEFADADEEAPVETTAVVDTDDEDALDTSELED